MSDDDLPARRRVVMSAYACGPGPGYGSEPGAGWAFARAAARSHDVVVLTRERFRDAISAELEADPELAAHLHPVYVSLDERLERRKRRGFDVYWYYALWQREAASIIRGLHQEKPFDIGHHVTFASDWLPCGLVDVPGIPMVWGPVGGSTTTPPPLRRWIGRRASLGESARSLLSAAARGRWGDRAARRARVVVAMNDDVARRFASARRVVVEPNCAIEIPGSIVRREPGDAPETRTAVFVGRLVGWKGERLAAAALAHPAAEGWTLDVYGEGSEEPTLRADLAELGIASRVRLLGQQPRETVLQAIADADAMLFPSMHDSAGWVVAEAVSLGCPVVCLDVGGPPIIVGDRGSAVSPYADDVVADLAMALGAVAGRYAPTDRWAPDRLPDLVDAWYADAVAQPPATTRR